MRKLIWDSKYLIPNFIKNLIPENLYKIKLLKEFIIVAMLRNYETNLGNKSIIINKYLITKPIETKDLEITFTHNHEVGSYIEQYECNIFKIIVHINNPFNPTEINLFGNENKFHLYQLAGDSSLHINLSILTFFKILSSDSELIKLRKKSKKDDYFLSNSNLSFFITELIKSQEITSYKKDNLGNIVSDFEYKLSDFENYDPLKFNYSKEMKSYWRFDLRDILIFYHNIWWEIISRMFYLYKINVWSGAIVNNTNKNRLRSAVLQLLGGFSKLNLLEKIEQSQKEHYALSDNSFMELKKYEKKLVKLSLIEKLDENLIHTIIENLSNNFKNQIELTETIISKLESIVNFENLTYDLFDERDDIEFNNYPASSTKNPKVISYTQLDKVNLIN